MLNITSKMHVPKKRKNKKDPMTEKTPEIEKLAGLCQHGNFPSTCLICRKETETALIREKNKESKEWKALNFEAFGISVPSAKHPERNEDAMTVIPSENLAIIADGVGGEKAGNIASRTVTEDFMSEYAKARETVSKITTEEYSKKIKDIITNSTLYKEDIPQIIEKLAKIKIPEEVWHEAVTLRETAISLSKKILKKGQSKPELKGMASTLTSVKIVEVPDGRMFAIFLNVGDSEAYLKSKNKPIERSTISDSGLDRAIAAGLIDLPKEISRDARKLDEWARANLKKTVVTPYTIEALKFSLVNQALGQEEEVIPHITIEEVRPGDRLMLCSDGIIDNDGKRRFEKILEADSSAEEQSKAILAGAEEGLKNNEGKGWDDMTVQVLKITKRERLTPEEQYARWIENFISKSSLSQEEAKIFKSTLQKEKESIAKKAIELVKEGKARDAEEAMTIIGQEMLEILKRKTA